MTTQDTIYGFKAELNNGEEIALSRYEGKVLLIVNTASQCGFTPQYDGLEKLYKDYKERGFEILAFPSNQFLKQEPGTDKEIREFCDLHFNVSFPLFSKINVNGKEVHPLYQYLKKNKRGFLGTKKIKWNFTKFLIDREGKAVKRFAPMTKPVAIQGHIERLL